MRLYDPTTGTWYDYTPATSGGGGEGGDSGSPASLNPAPYKGGPNILQPGATASESASQILAAEMQQWETTYRPVEMNLLNQSSLNNPNVLPDAVNSATTTTNEAYDAMAGVGKRQMAARGITPTADQAAVSNRLTGLSRAAAVAGAQNNARQMVSTQDQLIALGSAPNPQIVQQGANAKYATPQ
jgi:hypothetical protein